MTPARTMWSHLNVVAHELPAGHASDPIPTTWGTVNTTSQGWVRTWADADPHKARAAAWLDAHPHLPQVGIAVASVGAMLLVSWARTLWWGLLAGAVVIAALYTALNAVERFLPRAHLLSDYDSALVALLEQHPAPDDPTWPTTTLPSTAVAALATTMTTHRRPDGTPWALREPGAREALDKLLEAMREAHNGHRGGVDEDLVRLAHALPDTVAGLTAARRDLTR